MQKIRPKAANHSIREESVKTHPKQTEEQRKHGNNAQNFPVISSFGSKYIEPEHRNLNSQVFFHLTYVSTNRWPHVPKTDVAFVSWDFFRTRRSHAALQNYANWYLIAYGLRQSTPSSEISEISFHPFGDLLAYCRHNCQFSRVGMKHKGTSNPPSPADRDRTLTVLALPTQQIRWTFLEDDEGLTFQPRTSKSLYHHLMI
ncbi:hypothetical protein K435DRAFT_857812 [Dendrothele bispora CBS 962.96]|uniref:Uncharacterized protein n=1 Tax=Dendrothele bispora (strain CBS 962.96) TaxID=1314807 RepID=A0A4S8M563_DENBC|nr:hypothetical protein K435DRAFT_857812 [Dendrothele bispora CBS 962.96]